jgi:hypothetical protein
MDPKINVKLSQSYKKSKNKFSAMHQKQRESYMKKDIYKKKSSDNIGGH